MGELDISKAEKIFSHKNSERYIQDAKTRVAEAFDALAKQSGDQIKNFVEDVENEIASAVKGISSSVVENIQKVKNELNVADAVRENPWGWVLGASAIGATTAILYKERKPAVNLAKKVVAAGGQSAGGLALLSAPRWNWYLMAAEAGLAFLQARRAASAHRAHTH